MWQITILICTILSTVAAQQINGSKFQDLIELTTVSTSASEADVVKAMCGNAQKMVDECFKDLKPPLAEFLKTTKIAISKEEIDGKCNIFSRGMKCFDDYSARCLSNYKQDLFRSNVETARRFFSRFCNDSQYQNDYLRNKECLSYIQEDWARCTQDFQQIVSDELHGKLKNSTKKFMEFCCARHAYENCIYNSARFKCYKHSAKFARDTAKMLADERHFKNCELYESALCAAGQTIWPICAWHYVRLTLLVLLLLLLTLCRIQTP